MSAKHTWTFKASLRARAFGWNGSRLACQRLKEAVSEIKKVAKVDAVTAGDGVVSLMERIWPACEHIDTSSGTLGSAVNWTQGEVLPIAIEAPSDRETRDQWLVRLWQAIQDDGVDYLWMVEDRWGELCGSPDVASFWADELIELLRTAWSDPRPGNCVRGTCLCLASLVAAGRSRELLEVLALERFPFWHHRKFGAQALAAEGRTDEALVFAEASRGLNQPDIAIDAACEKILLDASRTDEAYDRYALTANASSTGLATFRTIANKYPCRDRRSILMDLAASGRDPGHWFAAAKTAGFLDLAREFARTGRTDPRTLTRASRDLLEKDARFCMQVGRLAIERILEGYGYELTPTDVIDAYQHFMAAAQKLDVATQARDDVIAIATKAKQDGGAFSDTLIRQCSPDPQAAVAKEQRTWTKRNVTKH